MGAARAVDSKVPPAHEEMRGVAEKVWADWVAIQRGEEISGLSAYMAMVREAQEAEPRMGRVQFAAFNLEMPSGVLLASMVGLGDRVRALGQEVRSLSRTIAGLAEEIAGLRERLETTPIIRQSRLLDVGTPEYVVKQPIEVTIEEYDEEIVARWPETETFGSGATESEALTALKSDILSLYEDLAGQRPEELGRLPTAWWRLLNRVLEEHG